MTSTRQLERLIGRIDQQSWGEGEHRQYKTVLVANEIMLVRSPSDTSEVGEAPAPAADVNYSREFRTIPV